MAKEKVSVEDLEKKYELATTVPKDLDVVESGSVTLDMALDCGGYPVGKIIEVQGPESSGKSTAAIHAIERFQKKFPNRKCALFDFEHSFNKNYAERLGVDVENLLIYQPDNQEQALNMITALIENELISLAVIDSHTSAQPSKVVAAEVGEQVIGLQARFYSVWLSTVKHLCEIHKTTIFAVSQMRANIGVMYGPSETTTSGNSWKFYADVRMKFQKQVDKDNEQNKTTITVIKNKCGRPFGVANVELVWGEGFDQLGEIVDLAIEQGLIKKGGAWLTYEEVKVQGKEKFKELLRDNEDFKLKLKGLVLANVKK